MICSCFVPEARVAGEEAVGNGDAALVGKLRARQAELGDAGPQEGVGELDENAGAVARRRVGARRATVLEVVERRQREIDHVMAWLAVQAGDAGDPARVVLEAWVVEAGGTGRRRRPDGSGSRAAHAIKNTGPSAR